MQKAKGMVHLGSHICFHLSHLTTLTQLSVESNDRKNLKQRAATFISARFLIDLMMERT